MVLRIAVLDTRRRLRIIHAWPYLCNPGLNQHLLPYACTFILHRDNLESDFIYHVLPICKQISNADSLWYHEEFEKAKEKMVASASRVMVLWPIV